MKGYNSPTVDSTKRLPQSKRSLKLDNTVGEKLLSLRTEINGRVTASSSNSCATVEQPNYGGIDNRNNIHNVKIDFERCDELSTFVLTFTGSGAQGQQLSGNTRVAYQIDKDTRFVNLISFANAKAESSIEYTLSRNVPHKLEVLAQVDGGRPQKTSITVNIGKNTEENNRKFKAAVAESIVDSLTALSGVEQAIKEKKKVKVIFRLSDRSIDNLDKVIGAFELEAFSFGINRGEVDRVITEVRNRVTDRGTAVNLAKKILGYFTEFDEDIAADRQKQASVEQVTNLIHNKRPRERNRWLNILKIAGNVGLKFLGVPVSF